MNILVTGANGFLGKNLIASLKNMKWIPGLVTFIESDVNILAFGSLDSEDLLEKYCANADFVFHLAGINRPTDDNDFRVGNILFTELLTEKLRKYSNNCPIVFASSTQTELGNIYGDSKEKAEQVLIRHGQDLKGNIFVFRLTNVFGKWSKPNYNSVVATFCHNVARDITINIHNPETVLNLVYVDDVIRHFISTIQLPRRNKIEYLSITPQHDIKLGTLAEMIYSFKQKSHCLNLPVVGDDFINKLYATYLSYQEPTRLRSSLKMNCDARGSFTELIRTIGNGQISVNITKPGIIKGQHWHHTKNEKFIVVSGLGVIRLRNYFSDDIVEYKVSGSFIEAIDIPVGYVHNIENIGTEDLVTIMWANEPFDPDRPDTFPLNVLP